MASVAIAPPRGVAFHGPDSRPSQLVRKPGPRFAFDVCQDYYVEARETLIGKINITKIDSPINKQPWKPQVRPRSTDYCADYERAGRVALADPHLASRLIMFLVYHISLAPYERARGHLGVSEMTWVNWSEEIRDLVGRELLNRGMFPPSRYMQPNPLRKFER